MALTTAGIAIGTLLGAAAARTVAHLLFNVRPAGNWKLEAGSWKLEAGSWKLEAGN